VFNGLGLVEHWGQSTTEHLVKIIIACHICYSLLCVCPVLSQARCATSVTISTCTMILVSSKLTQCHVQDCLQAWSTVLALVWHGLIIDRC
jgi:isoprenylcysteine carboxyl methyltransferase (ICMT) family protein YpbQ